MKTTITYLKGLFALLIIVVLASCEKKEQPIQIRINQFKQTTVSGSPTLVLSAQKGNEIGSDKWRPLSDQIVGFVYEEGYIYDLLVVETEIKYSSTGDKKAYQLKQVLSKTKAQANVPFDLDLKLDKVKFINGNANTGYNILDEVKIDCGSLCNELNQILQSNTKKLSGKFILNNDGSIKLVELLSE